MHWNGPSFSLRLLPGHRAVCCTRFLPLSNLPSKYNRIKQTSESLNSKRRRIELTTASLASTFTLPFTHLHFTTSLPPSTWHILIVVLSLPSQTTSFRSLCTSLHPTWPPRPPPPRLPPPSTHHSSAPFSLETPR